MVRRWVLLLLTFQTAATAQEAKLAQELQAARRAVDELKSNLNEQWFEFWSQKTIPSEGLVRRCRGVVFRSKDCFYCSFTRSCLLYTSPSPRDISGSRMPSSA